MTPLDCDICVIGAGSGGLSVAAAAAQLGRKVVVIEKGQMGGDCLNYGCVPSKALLAAARHAQALRQGACFGIEPVEPVVDFKRVHDHVKDVIASIAPIDSQERFEGLGCTVVRSPARFLDHQRVEAGGLVITARRFVIAAGSSPSLPSIPGLAGVPHLTNENLFDLTERPRHLIIIGGGPVGVEMAQAYRRLGAAVTVLEAASPLGKDDPELAAIVLSRLKSEGVEIKSHLGVTEVRQRGETIDVTIEGGDSPHIVTGSHLLVAAGRTPNLEGLDLERAGIAYSSRGITVDEGLKTTNRQVYAIGDIAGGLQFTHLANYHAGLVIRNALFRLPVSADTRHIPRVTYTDPELAQIGLTEAEASGHGIEHKVMRSSFQDNDRARAERETDGLIKVVVGRGGRILGVGIVAPSAGELIQTWSLAMAAGLRIKALTGMVAPYPTFGEAGRRVAIAYYAGLATSPWVRHVIGLLARLG